jgi:chromosome segregation ATPase
MDLDQAIQMINWLDEEHRKDKAMISEMSGQLTQQYAQIGALGKSIQDLEERIARLQSQALRYSQVEQALGQTKAEVQSMLDQTEKRRLAVDEDQYKIRQLERERFDPIFSSMQLQIEALQQFQRSIIGDHELLSRVDLTLPTYQTEIEEGIKRVEEINHRIALVEEWVPRFGQLATEQRQLSERLNKERADAVDAARRAEQVRARHMAEWAEQMKASRREIDDWISNMRTIQEQHKESRKVYGEMAELEDRLKQMEARLLQWQRLVEDARRKENDQIRGDVEKRWQQQLGEWQYLRDEWNKRMAAVTDRMGKMEDWRPEVASQLHDLVERLDKERREREKIFPEILKLVIDLEKQRATQVDKAVGDLMARAEAERTMPKSRKSAVTPKVETGA